ncbi:MAG: CHAT domain-containing protein [Xenococcus sp. (in: cyanobacteria)]
MTAKILIIASNPQDTERIRIDKEIKKIKDLLRTVSQRGKYSLEPELAVRKEELQSIIVREKPRIIHFCGHGTNSQELVLENDRGQQDFLASAALGNLLKLYSNQIECVVLNVCYSEELAQAIHQHINYVIGTKREILDEAAIAFSKGFYGALGEKESIERAFELGCNQIQIEIYGDSKDTRKLIPVYSSTSNEIINLPQHEVLKILVKKPPNQINDSDPVLPKPNNPFIPLTGRIDEPKLVFGREQEIRQIFETLNSGSCVALIGDREVGKSSLLQVIYHKAEKELVHKRKPIYLNLQVVENDDDFYEELCYELEIEKCRRGRLNRLLNRKTDRFLLLIDEIEKMIWDGFTKQLRGQLRGLAEGIDAPLRLVVAASTSLDKLFPDSDQIGMTSPLKGICIEEEIRSWDQSTVYDFIDSRLKATSINFTTEEIDKIIADSKGHPKQVMQWCYQLYRQKCHE